MRITQQIRRAAVVGAFAELVFVTPLFLVSYSGIGEMVPFGWVEVLNKLQMPGFLLVQHLFHTYEARLLADRLPPQWWVYVAQGLAVLIQAALFALITFGAIYAVGLRRVRQRADSPV